MTRRVDISSTLSPRQNEVLRQAPDGWQRCELMGSMEALARRGLLDLRPKPGTEKSLMCSWQWRITAAGRVVREQGQNRMSESRQNHPEKT